MALLEPLTQNCYPTMGQHWPCQIPMVYFKHCAHQVAPILRDNYNQSLYSEQLPSDWLMASVTPLVITAVQSLIG